MACFLQNLFSHSNEPEKEMFMVPQIVFSLFLSIGIFFLAFTLEVGKMGLGSNLNALMIVLGGTFSATLMAYPWKRLVWTAHIVKRAYISQNEIDWTIDAIVTLARTYRKSGIRSLERLAEEIPDGLLKTGVELIAYSYTKDKIEQILEKEAQMSYSQYETAYKILYNMARLAPALGLTGTIVNLIRVFGHINDSQSLIGYMAIALLSTFYGVVLANLCFIPLSNKIKEFMDQEQIRLELIQEGILDVYDEENPKAIEYKLEALSSSTIFKPSLIPSRSRLFVVPPPKDVSSVTL
jgi:chemotaxis protein MotA